MSKTENYGLHLTDDSAETFLNWRKKMNGTDLKSNMQIIDKVLSKKADRGVDVPATLRAGEWVGTEPPFIQELSVDGLAKDQDGSIGLAHDATFEQRNIARKAMLAIIGQLDGKLIIAADGKIPPEKDIPVSIILQF